MTDEAPEFPEALPIYYYGRKWDAPLYDDAHLVSEEFAQAMFGGGVPAATCSFCGEQMTLDDDLLIQPYAIGHLECHLRSALGDVQHLENRCLCARGSGNEIVYDSDKYDTYRESAKATLQWLLDHNRGRFHP